MKISQLKWHKRVYDYVWDKDHYFRNRSLAMHGIQQISICKYFWGVFFGCIIIPGLWLARIKGVLVGIGYTVAAIGLWWLIFEYEPPVVIGVPVALISTMLFMMGIGRLSWEFAEWHTTWSARRRLRKEGKITEEREPNIVGEFFKSAKNKVCPIISFIDDQYRV